MSLSGMSGICTLKEICYLLSLMNTMIIDIFLHSEKENLSSPTGVEPILGFHVTSPNSRIQN